MLKQTEISIERSSLKRAGSIRILQLTALTLKLRIDIYRRLVEDDASIPDVFAEGY